MTSSFHRPHVARGIDGTGRVRHRGIAEQAHDVKERVGVAERGDVEQGRRAGLARGRAAHIGEFDGRGGVLFRVEEGCQAVEPRIGHARDADVRVLLA